MLLQQTHITAAMSLDAHGVSTALRQATAAAGPAPAFMGMTCNGSFVYECVYINEQGFVESCRVYVQYDDNGTLVANY